MEAALVILTIILVHAMTSALLQLFTRLVNAFLLTVKTAINLMMMLSACLFVVKIDIILVNIALAKMDTIWLKVNA